MVSQTNDRAGAASADANERNAQSAASAWFEGVSVEGSDDSVLAVLERETLPRYLLERRWYGAKDAGRPAVRIEELISLPVQQHPMCVAVLHVEPPNAPAQRYSLPLMLVPSSEAFAGHEPVASVLHEGQSALLVDAFSSDTFVRDLLARMTGDSSSAEAIPGLAFHATRALAKGSDLHDADIQRSSAEQSNTSIRIGGTAMFKGLRKLEAGAHPELEMSRYLTEVAQFPNTPALLGHVELAANGASPTTLCVMQALVPNKGDGWSYVLDLFGSASGSGSSETLPEPLHDVANRLGRRTAELHHALAAPTDDPAFEPEAVSTAEAQQWISRVEQMADAALNGLARKVSALEGSSRQAAEDLLSRRAELMAQIADAPKSVDIVRTRIHGDYHLGQVLIAEDGDVFIIDFEGEPMRSLDERRGKQSPMRDVAGMVRSLAYASAVARADVKSQAGEAERGVRITDYGKQMSAVFLEAYRGAIKGCPSYPESSEAAAQLLRLFLLEKALYEVAYELANRPDWVQIPIAGVLELLNTRA